MQLKDYQLFTKTTAVYPKEAPINIMYCALGLAGETGEVCEKIKKYIRDNDETKIAETKKELGDVFWYLVRLSDELGFDVDDILNENIMKLKKRLEENKLGGSGDDR